MRLTPNRLYPYPECSPPLVEDVSDIAQMRDFALAVDSDVNALAIRANDELVNVPAARMTMVNTANTTLNDTVPFFDSVTFDTTQSGTMADPVLGAIRLEQPGMYFVGCYAVATSTVYQDLRTGLTLNGALAVPWSVPAEITTTNQQTQSHEGVVITTEENVTLSVVLRSGVAGPVYDYACRVWAWRMSHS